MFIIKNFFKDIISIFVFIRFRNIFKLHEYLHNNKITKGIKATVYSRYLDKHNSFIGINTTFEDYPYFPHGISGVFMSENARIGKNCVIFQQVTIGSSIMADSLKDGSPVIGDNCYIGAGAKIIGNIKVGNNVRIGANAVVYEDIPNNSVVVNSKTRIIKKDEPLDNRFIKKTNSGILYYDFETKSFKKLEN